MLNLSMKNTYAFVIVIFIANAGLLSGCKKKDDPKPISKAEQLAGTTSKNWKLTAATATFGTSIDLFTPNTPYSLPDCFKDNIITFSPDGKYQTSEGATSCTPPVTDNGTWAFNSGETQLTLTSSKPSGGAIYSGVPLTIKTLNSTTIQGDASVPYTVSGVPLSIPVSFTFTAVL